MILGIDIGTSYSSAAMMLGEKAVPVSVGDGHQFSIPSAVFVEEDGELLIGRGANSRRMKNPSCYKANFKRDLGTQQPYLLGSQEFLPEQLYMAFFRYFAQKAKEQSGQEIEKTYITHPAGYGSNKKQLLQQAADYAGLSQTELIDEPTAAALHYIVLGQVTTGERLLVYDMGGGTFDLSLLEVTEQGIRAMTAALGLLNCGGVVFDKYIYQDIVREFSRENDMTKALESIKFRSILNDVALKVKHLLSENKEALDGIPFGFGEVLDYTLTREQFNEMIQKDVRESCFLVERIAKNAGISLQDIDKVLCVGGSTRIPYVRESLEETVGSPVLYNTNPELAVCLGAVRKGAFDEQHRVSSIQTGKEETPVQQEKNGKEHCGEGDRCKETDKKVKSKAYRQKLLTKENVQSLFAQQRYVAIPEGYTDIGERAFESCISLETIKMPDSLVSIGRSAFLGCSSLTKVVLPSGLLSLEEKAFGCCTSLTSVLLPDKMEKMGEAAFLNCSSLIKVVLPSRLLSLEESVFEGCESLETIDIPSEVTEIQAHAFTGCKRLTSVLLPDKLEKIGNGAFACCYNLTKVVLPSELLSLGKSVFLCCSSLTKVVLPSGLLSLGDSVFEDCESLKIIDIPSEVKEIPADAFAGCKRLTSVLLPDKLEKIGERAFCSCHRLLNVVLPSGLLSLEEGVFYDCPNLISVSIPASVTKIDPCTFSSYSNRNFTIICQEGSYAHTYAMKHRIKYTNSGAL